MNENNRIYNRIKVVLAIKRVKNKMLAEYLNVSEQTVSKWCTNYRQPSLPELYSIAKYLNVQVGDLLEPVNKESLNSLPQTSKNTEDSL